MVHRSVTRWSLSSFPLLSFFPTLVVWCLLKQWLMAGWHFTVGCPQFVTSSSFILEKSRIYSGWITHTCFIMLAGETQMRGRHTETLRVFFTDWWKENVQMTNLGVCLIYTDVLICNKIALSACLNIQYQKTCCTKTGYLIVSITGEVWWWYLSVKCSHVVTMFTKNSYIQRTFSQIHKYLSQKLQQHLHKANLPSVFLSIFWMF